MANMLVIYINYSLIITSYFMEFPAQVRHITFYCSKKVKYLEWHCIYHWNAICELNNKSKRVALKTTLTVLNPLNIKIVKNNDLRLVKINEAEGSITLTKCIKWNHLPM